MNFFISWDSLTATQYDSLPKTENKTRQMLDFCLVSLHFYPIYPGHGTRQPLTRADLLSRKGHKVQVVTGFPPQLCQKRSGDTGLKFFKKEKLGDIDILRVFTPPLSPNGIFNRLILYLSFVVFSFIGLMRLPPCKILYLLDPYPQLFLALPGLVYSKIRRSKLVILVSDLWPEVLVESGAIKSDILARLMNGIVKFSLKLSDKVIVITNRLKFELIKKGIDANKISVVELATNTDVFKPTPDAFYIEKFREKFVVMYSGIFGPAYDFDTLLQAAKILDVYPEILFVIRGDGERKAEILSKISELNLKNTIMLGPVDSIEEVVSCLSATDVFVVPMTKGDCVSGSTHPSKILEFMAVEKPVVCAATDEIKSLINRSKAGLVVPPEDPKKLAESVLSLLNVPDQRLFMGKQGRKYVSENFSYTAIHQKLVDAVSS